MLPCLCRDRLPGLLRDESWDWVAVTSPEAAAVFLEGWEAAGRPQVCAHTCACTCMCKAKPPCTRGCQCQHGRCKAHKNASGGHIRSMRNVLVRLGGCCLVVCDEALSDTCWCQHASKFPVVRPRLCYSLTLLLCVVPIICFRISFSSRLALTSSPCRCMWPWWVEALGRC